MAFLQGTVVVFVLILFCENIKIDRFGRTVSSSSLRRRRLDVRHLGWHRVRRRY